MQFALRSLSLSVLALVTWSAIASAQTETTVYNFQGAPDGSVPSAHLIRDAAGNFYGTTSNGGAHGYGAVFKIDTKGNTAIIHSFSAGADGANPVAALTLDSTGNLYGTTQSGGHSNNGTIFKLAPTAKETVLYSFKGASDGAAPLTALVRDASGNLFGTTSLAGNTSCSSPLLGSGCGTLFKLDASGKLIVLHTFGSGSDGASPVGDLLRDSSGNFYGTTYGGGAHSYGCVYKLAKNGTLTVLYSFNFGVGTDGARPVGGLVRDSNGNLYGTTRFGGFFGNNTCQGFGCGTVFKVDASGAETVLYTFMGNPDGYDPKAGLVADSIGNLYGTTSLGGENSLNGEQGTVFRLAPDGQETVLHSFTGTDGWIPRASLIRGTGSAYYGTASQGGTGTAGVVFKIVP